MTDNRVSPPSRLDPTRVTNQPALRTSSGLVWLVMGGLFAAVSLIPFAMLIFTPDTRSGGLALAVAVAIIALYGAMVITRVVTRRRERRLRIMAGCMLTMALVALVGVGLCALIEWAPQ